jgi:hypothetical protein
MLGILWAQTASFGTSIPILDIAAFIAGIVIAFGSCTIAAAAFSPDQ